MKHIFVASLWTFGGQSIGRNSTCRRYWGCCVKSKATRLRGLVIHFDMLPAQQLDFPSLTFPKDRTVLTVGEVAERWRVSDRHVVDLIEEGKLHAFDISGKRDYFRVHMNVLAEISKQSGLPVETLLQLIRSARPATSRSPSFYRIPVEGYNGFIRENHSLAVAGK